MTTSKYFNNYQSTREQSLYEDLINECIQIWGIDCSYLPRTSASADGFNLLFGDDPTKVYSDNYQIEVYIEDTEEYEGGEFFSKFGLEVRKEIRFLMPNRAFQREVPSSIASRPREGDLIYLTTFQTLFEIKYVDEEYFFYRFGGATEEGKTNQFFGFALVCEKFRFNDEVIDSGIEEITAQVNALKYVYNFQMANTGNTGTFTNEEMVFQTANNNIHGTPTATANVMSWNLPTGLLQLKDIVGVFTVNTNIFGSQSRATWNLSSYDTTTSINHPLSDNDDISSAANGILNFDESNPFGNP